MSVSYLMTMNEFVYLSCFVMDFKICCRQFEGGSELLRGLRSGNRLLADSIKSDTERSLCSKGYLRFIKNQYKVDSVIWYILEQMKNSSLSVSDNNRLSVYLCEEICVYVLSDRLNPNGCCIFPLQKDSADPPAELTEILGELSLTEYTERREIL